jgi:hypothetical protein
MKRTIVLLFLLVFCSATAMQAQAPAPKPDPELKKYSIYIGHWTLEGEDKAGPLGPGSKHTGEFTAQMTLGGFFFQEQWTLKRTSGESRGLGITRYDPVNKNFPCNVYWDDGTTWSGVLGFSGTTLTFTGKVFAGEKWYATRGTETFAADLMSFTHKEEISIDGKGWMPLWEFRATKTKDAPKK